MSSDLIKTLNNYLTINDISTLIDKYHNHKEQICSVCKKITEKISKCDECKINKYFCVNCAILINNENKLNLYISYNDAAYKCYIHLDMVICDSCPQLANEIYSCDRDSFSNSNCYQSCSDCVEYEQGFVCVSEYGGDYLCLRCMEEIVKEFTREIKFRSKVLNL